MPQSRKSFHFPPKKQNVFTPLGENDTNFISLKLNFDIKFRIFLYFKPKYFYGYSFMTYWLNKKICILIKKKKQIKFLTVDTLNN